MTSLQGTNIRLRPLEKGDLNLLYIWENDPSNWQVSKTLTPFSKNILEKYIENAHMDIFQVKQLRLVVTLKDSAVPVGLIDIFDFDPFHQRAGIGILIGDTEARNKGYASEALDVLLEYCFNTLMLKQVYCNILLSNEISIKLFESAGFVKSGQKKSWIRTRSGWEDEYFYQLLHQDWKSRSS
jgi:diamine N-acetyltransferase